MSELLDSLQAALGSTYRIERELGGGGMSRVFVATETALGRRVVIKLLTPELAAGISADRFRREIQLAARLQHPHIVPLLAAGEVRLEGANHALLYFTMPFIDGESLRARLSRGPLPSAEALRIMREVADALDYAHRQNIVHRDIKPDNILLSNGHAVVTDFGVAKALTTSTTAGDVHATATSVGTVIGTPAYMAPEQGAGDPDVGPTADVYALGVTGFEMLSGQTPFKGTTPRAILAAQLTGDAPSLDTVRQDLSPTLPPLMRRMLARDPEHRPSARDLLGLLDQVGTPVPTAIVTPLPTPRNRWRVPAMAGGALAILLAVLWYFGLLPGGTLMAEGKFGSRDPIVLAEVEVPGDSALASALTEALRVDLAQSNVLQLVSASQVRSTLRLMKQPEDRTLAPSLAREVALRSGAKGVIAGKAERVGGQVVVTLRLVSPESGDDLAAFRETARDTTQILSALDAVTKQMRRRIGESLKRVRGSQPMEAVTTSSLAALQKYSQSIKASDAANYDQARQLLEQALAIDSTFAMAWRKLGIVYGNIGEANKGKEPLSRAFRYRDRLPDRERYLTEAAYYSTVANDDEKSITAYRSVIETDSLDPIATNNLAILLGQQGDSIGMLRYTRTALIGRDSSAVAMGNLGMAFLNAALADSASALAGQLRTMFPGSTQADQIDAYAAYERGQYAEAIQKGQPLLANATVPPGIKRDVSNALMVAAAVQGELRQAAQYGRERAQFSAESDNYGSVIGTYMTLAAIDVAIRRDPARGKRLLDSVVAANPLAKLPVDERPYFSLSIGYAMSGDLPRARALLNEAMSTLDTTALRASAEDQHFARGVIALREGQPALAVREFQSTRSKDSNCRACTATLLSEAFLALGQKDSAIVYGERYLGGVSYRRYFLDGDRMVPTLRQLGQLYQEKGDREKAAAYYQQAIDLWRNADPELQPQVAELKQSLAEVVGEKK